MSGIALQHASSISSRPTRLGFLGVGWIGRNRMEAMLATGHCEAVVIAEPSTDMMTAAAKVAPSARFVGTLDELLTEDLDGVVIATPSAQHAEQSIRALHAGRAVFCQKPLGRNTVEVKAVLAAAKAANKLLGVDLSYRHTEGMRRIKQLLKAGDLGNVMAIDLTFHNAYGPDKPWFYDRLQSGGGCVIDLGVHLIDLALWAMDFPKIIAVSSHLMEQGKRVSQDRDHVEDYAVATLKLASGTIVRLACSWRLNAGCDCVIDASFYGTGGGAALRNIDGSFYNFVAHRFKGTTHEQLAQPPDDWGGRAAIAWAQQLKKSSEFDPAAEGLVAVSQAIDLIYQSGSMTGEPTGQ
ncbi:Gfo/Idh/MocA family oxidoreductase [Rhizobium cauense]|uniref:Gfo/Idh/MocA family protein n=1 Tax=Rhizobium cauense TaxID=1166683 RepID=UPI001C6EA4C0|nr:Gfo/Idh/MocA family oxidoreductase [Rhizobium cauense]MBW9117360.1 Gfo/Idh/MocA family oxidoreductase [Rhizobium cauense]